MNSSKPRVRAVMVRFNVSFFREQLVRLYEGHNQDDLELALMYLDWFEEGLLDYCCEASGPVGEAS